MNNFYQINRALNKVLRFGGVKVSKTGKVVVGIIALAIFFLSTSAFFKFYDDKNPNPSPEVLSEISETKTVKVTRVVDGDTIEVEDNNYRFKIRLVGIDTPETVHPDKQVQCFGKEASNKTKELIEGKEIRFSLDDSQSEEDKYGRVLAYVWRAEDNLFVNEYLVNEGYAKLYETTPPFYFRNKFYELENAARQQKRGLWGDVCTNN